MLPRCRKVNIKLVLGWCFDARNSYPSWSLYTVLLYCDMHSSDYYMKFVTGSAKTCHIAHDWKFNLFPQTQRHINTLSRSYCPWQEVQFIATNTKTHQYTVKFHCQNEVVLGGLLVLAAFPQATDDPCKWSESLMELWWAGRGLCVTPWCWIKTSAVSFLSF